jgi:hypothetical protein
VLELLKRKVMKKDDIKVGMKLQNVNHTEDVLKVTAISDSGIIVKTRSCGEVFFPDSYIRYYIVIDQPVTYYKYYYQYNSDIQETAYTLKSFREHIGDDCELVLTETKEFLIGGKI